MSEIKERLRNAIECVGELVPGQPNDPKDALAEIERLERELDDERSEIERILREYAVEVEMDRPKMGFSEYIEAAADLVSARGESDG